MQTLKLVNNAIETVKHENVSEITFEAWEAGGFVKTSEETLVLPNDLDLDRLAGDLSGFDTVIVEFPTFMDGRAFSQARRLREQYGFSGEIRARGEIGRDQVLFMVRAGINGFEAPESASRGFDEALQEYSLFYQGAADTIQPVWRLRLRQALAA